MFDFRDNPILKIYEETPKINIDLCKKNYNRTKINPLECYNKILVQRFGNIDEISFTLNKYYDKNGKRKVNPMYSKVVGEMILKVNMMDKEKYFVVVEASEINGEDKNIKKDIVAYSYEYTFNKKLIRAFKGVKKLYDISNPAESVLHEIVRLNPIWKIGYVNPDVNKFRTFSVDEQNLLDFLYDIQKTFECYIEFDTVTRTINVHKLEDIGQNKGLVLNERNYAKSLEIVPDYSEVVTRLWAYGKDDISINKYTTGGQSYVEMYDYYLNNPDMVDQDLVTSYNAYQKLLQEKDGEFKAFLEQLSVKNKDMYALKSELAKLNADLKKIQDQIDVAINSMAGDGSPTELDLTALNTQAANKQKEIDAKHTQINNKQAEIDVINNQINELRKYIAATANFTEEQLMGLNEITFDRVYRDTMIENEEELYNEVVKNLPKMAQPAISFNLSVANFLKSIDHQMNWDKVIFSLGDFVNIENEILPNNIEVRLIEFTYQEDGTEFTMSFSNKLSLDDPLLLFEELGKKVNSSSTNLDINKFQYGKYTEDETEIMDYINGTLDLSAQEAIAGKNQEIVINDRGITLTNRDDSKKQLKLLSSLIAFTDDGFNKVKTCIKNGYLVADYLVGKVILGSQLIIQNTDSSFVIDNDALTIRDGAKNKKVVLGKYQKTPSARWGLQIFGSNGAGDIVLDDQGMLQTWQDSTCDNVASGKPLRIWVYIPATAKEIKEATLRFKLDYFRGFSTTVDSSSSSSVTSDSGGGTSKSTSSGGGTTNSTTSGGGTTKSTTAQAEAGASSTTGHNHGITSGI